MAIFLFKLHCFGNQQWVGRKSVVVSESVLKILCKTWKNVAETKIKIIFYFSAIKIRETAVHKTKTVLAVAYWRFWRRHLAHVDRRIFPPFKMMDDSIKCANNTKSKKGTMCVCVCVFVSVYLPHKKTKKVVKNLGTETDSIKSMKTNKHTHTHRQRERIQPQKKFYSVGGSYFIFFC